MNISQFFKDGNGAFSATRLAFLAWSFGVLVAWIYVSWQKQALQGLDSSLLTVLGILMTGKVAQSFSPNDGTAATPQPAQAIDGNDSGRQASISAVPAAKAA